ncbi:MAG: hypothetical protein IID41_00940 [Planctomycetes bacterium]|nr:hypothetical protein [Planctomycetota bacterium]
MTDALFTIGFASMAIGMWWLAPWACLVICGIVVMCTAARMEQTRCKGEKQESDT